jgi:hypothetical protein
VFAGKGLEGAPEPGQFLGLVFEDEFQAQTPFIATGAWWSDLLDQVLEAGRRQHRGHLR